jgi:hypothetical protein
MAELSGDTLAPDFESALEPKRRLRIIEFVIKRLAQSCCLRRHHLARSRRADDVGFFDFQAAC